MNVQLACGTDLLLFGVKSLEYNNAPSRGIIPNFARIKINNNKMKLKKKTKNHFFRDFGIMHKSSTNSEKNVFVPIYT